LFVKIGQNSCLQFHGVYIFLEKTRNIIVDIQQNCVGYIRLKRL